MNYIYFQNFDACKHIAGKIGGTKLPQLKVICIRERNFGKLQLTTPIVYWPVTGSQFGNKDEEASPL